MRGGVCFVVLTDKYVVHYYSLSIGLSDQHNFLQKLSCLSVPFVVSVAYLIQPTKCWPESEIDVHVWQYLPVLYLNFALLACRIQKLLGKILAPHGNHASEQENGQKKTKFVGWCAEVIGV